MYRIVFLLLISISVLSCGSSQDEPFVHPGPWKAYRVSYDTSLFLAHFNIQDGSEFFFNSDSTFSFVNSNGHEYNGSVAWEGQSENQNNGAMKMKKNDLHSVAMEVPGYGEVPKFKILLSDIKDTIPLARGVRQEQSGEFRSESFYLILDKD